MKSGKMLFTFVVGISVFVSAHAAPPRSVDVRDFDIAGVKTGMDFDQAVAAAANHLQIALNEIKPCPPRDDRVNKTRVPCCFRYRKDGVDLFVEFRGRVPVDKARPLVVWRVNYRQPLSQQNQEAMAKAALAKYGEPSWLRPVDNTQDGPTKQMFWCAKPGSLPHYACAQEKQASLELGWTTLTLTDWAWVEAEDKFIEDLGKAKKKAFEDSNARKPSF